MGSPRSTEQSTAFDLQSQMYLYKINRHCMSCAVYNYAKIDIKFYMYLLKPWNFSSGMIFLPK